MKTRLLPTTLLLISVVAGCSLLLDPIESTSTPSSEEDDAMGFPDVSVPDVPNDNEDARGAGDDAPPDLPGGCSTPAGYLDSDGDRFGDAAKPTCTLIAGAVPNADDCDDTDVGINPGAAEICDAIDNDCDDEVDEEGLTTFYPDMDGDGFGSDLSSTRSCEQPANTTTEPGDCDDANPDVNPGAVDLCGDGLDADCDPNGGCRQTGELVLADNAVTYIGTEDFNDGYAIAAGDLDGDGRSDVIVGRASADGDDGRAYLIKSPLGDAELRGQPYHRGDNDDQLGAAVAVHNQRMVVSAPNANNGNEREPVYFPPLPTVQGVELNLSGDYIYTNDNDHFGRALAAGPLGPGSEVLLIAERRNNQGRVYAVLEAPQGAASIGASASTTFVGRSSGSDFGKSVAVLGGRPAVLVGAPNDSGTGAVFLFPNPPGGELLASQAVTFIGAQGGGRMGARVANAGDLDGDGADDLIFHEERNDRSGRAYLFLRSQPLSGQVPLNQAHATFGGGGTWDLVGHDVASAGDFDGDGHADLLVARGSYGLDGGTTVAMVGVFYGPIAPGAHTLADADLRIMVPAASDDDETVRVLGAGDIDGDGADDIVLAFSHLNGDRGAVYILKGRRGP